MSKSARTSVPVEGLMRKLVDIEQRLPHVFTPASPVSAPHLLQGRDQLLKDISRTFARRGGGVAICGKRGVGKTSIAKVASGLFGGRVFYHSLGEHDTFGSLASAMLGQLSPGRALGAAGAGVVLEKDQGLRSPDPEGRKAGNRGPLVEVRYTPQAVAQALPASPTLIIIDDFERIEDGSSRLALSDLIKKISDSAAIATPMIIGLEESAEQLVEANESLRRNMAVLRVPGLTPGDIRSIVERGATLLGVRIQKDAVALIVEHSADLPYYVHLLCEGAVCSLLASIRDGKKSEYVVDAGEVRDSIDYALRVNQHPDVALGPKGLQPRTVG